MTEGLRVSVSERALLELLYDVGTHQGLEEARNLFEGLSNPGKEMLGRLLACCTSVKTVRLFLTAAPEVFANDIFAMKGGTAINLFVHDMPRLSVDIDVVYTPWQIPREQESSDGELTRERLANSTETSSSPMGPGMQNGEHLAHHSFLQDDSGRFQPGNGTCTPSGALTKANGFRNWRRQNRAWSTSLKAASSQMAGHFCSMVLI